MKKIISFTFLVAFFVVSLPDSASAIVTTGSLIKCPDFTAVYYLGEDGNRYVFPNERIYFSHYDDFNNVEEISCAHMAKLPLADNIAYRSGSRLVKIPSVPAVYFVEPGAVLREIPSEEVAYNLFGEDWASRVDDLSEAFFPRYTLGTPLMEGELPESFYMKGINGDVWVTVGYNSAELYLDISEYGDRIETYTKRIHGYAASLESVQSHYDFKFSTLRSVEDTGGIFNRYVTDTYSDIVRFTNEQSDGFSEFFMPSLGEFKSLFADDHVLGDLDLAEVVVIEYCDLEGPFCQRHHPNMHKLIDSYGGRVAWTFRHFPLIFHPEALPAALASECAAEQGYFWEFIDAIYEDETSEMGDLLYYDIAQDLGLTMDQFATCYVDQKYLEDVEFDMVLAEVNGVSGTPASFLYPSTGDVVMGAVPYETLVEMVENLLY